MPRQAILSPRTATVSRPTSFTPTDPPRLQRRLVGGNLQLNGDFEYAPSFTAATTSQGVWIDGTATGSTTNSQFAWATQTIVGTASVQYDTAESHSGNYSLKLTTGATSAEVLVAGDRSPFTQNTVRCLASTSYTLTYWMKTQVSSGTTGNMYAEVSARNGVGTNVTTYQGTLVTTTTGWTQYSVTFTTGTTTRFLLVRMNNGTGAGDIIGSAWFDDVTLTPTSLTTRQLA